MTKFLTAGSGKLDLNVSVKVTKFKAFKVPFSLVISSLQVVPESVLPML